MPEATLTTVRETIQPMEPERLRGEAPMDHVQPILRLLADGDRDEAYLQISQALTELGTEISGLRNQADLIQRLLVFYGDPDSSSKLSVESDQLTPQGRSSLVRKAALQLATEGRSELTTATVLDVLAGQGIRFSVKRPASLVGSVLSTSSQFRRVAQDRYQYKGG